VKWKEKYMTDTADETVAELPEGVDETERGAYLAYLDWTSEDSASEDDFRSHYVGYFEDNGDIVEWFVTAYEEVDRYYFVY
jgi:hypothetical protein